MTHIPGFVFHPVNEVSCKGNKMKSFTGTFVIPESHKYGNCRKLSEFQKLEVIQEGSFGVLYKAHDTRVDVNVFLKSFIMPSNFKDGFPKSVMKEIYTLKSFNHKNIIISYGVAGGNKLLSNHLILEYCPYSLKNLIDKNVSFIYEQLMIQSIIKQLMQGLDYIHDTKEIHRDITSQNIWFTETGVLKISGFSSICYFNTNPFPPSCTELRYKAPELLFEAKNYGMSIDIWAAGCIFAELLLKKPLFKGNSDLEVLESIVDVLGTPSETIWPGFNELLSDMDEKAYVFEKSIPSSHLRTSFSCFPPCYEVIKNIFIYFPNARHSTKRALKCSYFQDNLTACPSTDFSSILQSMPAIKQEPITME